MSKRSIDSIKADFLAALGDDNQDSWSVLAMAARELRGSYGMTLHEACVRLTGWAVEEGYIPEEAEDEAERQAELIVRAAE